jgi:alpha-N-acetylgalactosaminidase
MAPNLTLIGATCNMWRMFDDVVDSWDSVLSIIDYWGDNQDVLVPAAGPGRWNDMDMLIVGDFGLSIEQSRTQMAIWSICASPLFMSNDLRSISLDAVDILTNREVIAVNQDPLGVQGRRVFRTQQGTEVWARPLAGGDVAVVLFNRGGGLSPPLQIAFNFSQVGIVALRCAVRDLFARADIGIFQNGFEAPVPPTGVLMLRLSAQP